MDRVLRCPSGPGAALRHHRRGDHLPRRTRTGDTDSDHGRLRIGRPPGRPVQERVGTGDSGSHRRRGHGQDGNSHQGTARGDRSAVRRGRRRGRGDRAGRCSRAAVGASHRAGVRRVRRRSWRAALRAPLRSFESVPGQGAMATVDGRRVAVGSKALMDGAGHRPRRTAQRMDTARHRGPHRDVRRDRRHHRRGVRRRRRPA